MLKKNKPVAHEQRHESDQPLNVYKRLFTSAVVIITAHVCVAYLATTV